MTEKTFNEELENDLGPTPRYILMENFILLQLEKYAPSRLFTLALRMLGKELPPEVSPKAVQWKTYWRTPFLLVVSFCIGLGSALGQHFLYRAFHHNPEFLDDETERRLVVLYGRAMAYLSKLAFGECIVLCYRQRIWRTFRERALSVRAIDLIFYGTEDPSIFKSWEAVSNAPLTTIMAFVLWLVPLATVIISPSAFTFGWIDEWNTSSVVFPTLNFSAESTFDFRTPSTTSQGIRKISLATYNTTEMSATSDDWFDYYNGPSREAEFFMYKNMLYDPRKILENELSDDATRTEYCGKDYNCTLTTSFVGPGYKCEDTPRDEEDAKNFAAINRRLVPEGSYLYYTDFTAGDYEIPQSDILRENESTLDAVQNDFGVFKSEPVLWIGYSVNTRNDSSNISLTHNQTNRYDRFAFRCTHYETKYSLIWNFTGQSVKFEKSLDFIAPTVDTTFSQPTVSYYNYSDPGPIENFISPQDNVAKYKKISAYYAMGKAFRNLVGGYIKLTTNSSSPTVETELISTPFYDHNSQTIVSNLQDRLQERYGDIVVSLLSQPQMLAVGEKESLVRMVRLRATFLYDPIRYWACYAPVLIVTLSFLLIGAWTIWEDGTTFSVGFSRILATTRNPTLDEMSAGACLGNDPLPPALMRKKLQFGALDKGPEIEYLGGDQGQNVDHCAFGFPSEIGPIRKGGLYAGMSPEKRIEKRKKVKED